MLPIGMGSKADYISMRELIMGENKCLCISLLQTVGCTLSYG